jgi:NAD(P)H-dependent FMN reductase
MSVIFKHVLAISGSLRSASTNTAVLRTATAVAPRGVLVQLCDDVARLPHFSPDADDGALPPVVTSFRAAVAGADALLFCTPEYAGALPGSFKNALDWCVGCVGIQGKPVAWINASTGSGAVHAHASLRTVMGYVDAAIIEAACVHLPVTRELVNDQGLILDAEVRRRISQALTALLAEPRRS